MAPNECKICGGELIVKIGADSAVCDHCGKSVMLDPQAVRQYRNTYQSAQRLMRTGTLAGYTAALTRLQSISFIPEARETAAACERQMEAIRAVKVASRNHPGGDRKNTVLGIVIAAFLVLLLAALAVGIAYVIYRLIKGDLTQTDIIIIGSVAAAFVVLLIVGKIRS